MQHDDLEVLLRSRVPLIAVESRDESEVLKALTRACARVAAGNPLAKAAPGLSPTAGLPLFQWTVTDGLKRLDIDVGPPQRTIAEPIDILKHLRATPVAGAYALLDFHPYLPDPTLVRLLKDIAQDYAPNSSVKVALMKFSSSTCLISTRERKFCASMPQNAGLHSIRPH